MASKFSLALYPWVYVAQYKGSDDWSGGLREQEHMTPAEEAALSAEERQALLGRRNWIEGLPLVNYTTQYGFGCFEGLKAFPQKDGSLKLFRPDRNGERMHRSMEGLRMPPVPVELFVKAVRSMVASNRDLGFAPAYDPAWEQDNFLSASSVYVRPFSYSEPGIGLNLSKEPFFVAISTPVGSYFDMDAPSKAITTEKIRATPGGTGWIKCDANYVIPTLEKHAVMDRGYMEAVFLDAATQSFVEEGSSSNIFFLMSDGTLVTPTLEDTILPGITRDSIIQLARDRGVTVVERKVTIDEVMQDAEEAFVTGTAAGISYLESLTHKGTERVFRERAMGELTRELLHELKGLQYGAVADRHGWMLEV
ncbi:MAG: branched-chain-amino-acid transaminase [Spirochaeta sp.]|jgi:branched-chain amino acid aminotransferase|nr:branched-chain-amino-acid transaminase [Spirochaeta sp.]